MRLPISSTHPTPLSFTSRTCHVITSISSLRVQSTMETGLRNRVDKLHVLRVIRHQVIPFHVFLTTDRLVHLSATLETELLSTRAFDRHFILRDVNIMDRSATRIYWTEDIRLLRRDEVLRDEIHESLQNEWIPNLLNQLVMNSTVAFLLHAVRLDDVSSDLIQHRLHSLFPTFLAEVMSTIQSYQIFFLKTDVTHPFILRLYRFYNDVLLLQHSFYVIEILIFKLVL